MSTYFDSDCSSIGFFRTLNGEIVGCILFCRVFDSRLTIVDFSIFVVPFGLFLGPPRNDTTFCDANGKFIIFMIEPIVSVFVISYVTCFELIHR